MINQLQVFHFEDHQIQSFNVNNELFLRAIQLAEILGYKNPRDAIKTHVDKEDVVKRDTLTKGGKQKVLYVNESGMYALIFGSTLDTARRFKRWVTSEVLPAIRKTGSYSLTINPEQQQLIQQAVNERAFRTGEKHQAIYTKLHQEFKIPRYTELPASKFGEAIEFLGGVHAKSTQFTDDELCTLAWCYKAGELMRRNIKMVTEALYLLKSDFAPSFYSQGEEYARTFEDARVILERETRHIVIERQGFLSNNWSNVLPIIRNNSKSTILY